MIKVALVDDNSFLLRTTQEKLSFFDDLAVRLVAYDGQEILDQLKENHNIDIILMDIEMPGMNGIDATLQIKSKYPQIKILVLTVFDDDENIFNVIKAGADGYLLKEITPNELYQAIKETIEGGAAMHPSIAFKTLKLLRNPRSFEERCELDVKLSVREIEVLEQLSKGLSYNLIAQNLFLSPSTVRKHIENIYTKLQVHNKLEAIDKARNNNLI